MHHVLHPRSYSWLPLAFLILASGCPANPPDVSLRPTDGGAPDARAVDAAEPDAAGPQGDAGGAGDARPNGDGGGPGGRVREYGWPPSNEFTDRLDYPPNLVILQRLTVAADGDVAYLGMIVNGPSGTGAKIGLYRESNGLPSVLVAATDLFITTQGVNRLPPAERVFLTAGNYWSAVVFDDTTGLATSATSMSDLRTADVPFLQALPRDLASSTLTPSPDINVYLGVLEP